MYEEEMAVVIVLSVAGKRLSIFSDNWFKRLEAHVDEQHDVAKEAFSAVAGRAYTDVLQGDDAVALCDELIEAA